MSDLTSKTVLITGASGALGRALAERFAAAGAHTVLGARSNTEKLAADLPGDHLAVTLDVTSEEDWTAAVTAAEERFGHVDVLINNAAYLRVGTTQTIDITEWQRVFDTNVTGTLLGIRAVTPAMRRAGGGSIVIVNSIAGLTAAPELVAYSSSKWALRGLLRASAKELARDHIRVNSVHPGIINTPLAYGPDGQELVPVGAFPIPRQASADEIAGYVLFAASEQSAFSTGSEFLADGGFMLGPVA